MELENYNFSHQNNVPKEIVEGIKNGTLSKKCILELISYAHIILTKKAYEKFAHEKYNNKIINKFKKLIINPKNRNKNWK